MPAGDRYQDRIQTAGSRDKGLGTKMFSEHIFLPEATNFSGLIHNLQEDAITFLHHDRELRRRIKEEFTKQNIKTPGPGRLFVVDQNALTTS